MSTEFPQPATDSLAEMAFFFPSGRASGGLMFVYEVERDFLSAPREYCLLSFDQEAWIVSDCDAGAEQDYGLSQETDDDGNQHLIFTWTDRCVEIICTRVRLVKREYHAANAAQVLRRWLLNSGQ